MFKKMILIQKRVKNPEQNNKKKTPNSALLTKHLKILNCLVSSRQDYITIDLLRFFSYNSKLNLP